MINALMSCKAGHVTTVEEALNLLVDPADCLDLPALVDGAGNGKRLLDRDLGERRKQREQLRGRSTVAIDAGVGLLEDETGVER